MESNSRRGRRPIGAKAHGPFAYTSLFQVGSRATLLTALNSATIAIEDFQSIGGIYGDGIGNLIRRRRGLGATPSHQMPPALARTSRSPLKSVYTTTVLSSHPNM